MNTIVLKYAVDEEVPIPEGMRSELRGPFLIALTSFSRRIWMPKIRLQLPRVQEAMRRCGLNKSLGKSGAEMTDAQTKKLEERLAGGGNVGNAEVDPELIRMAKVLFYNGFYRFDERALRQSDLSEEEWDQLNSGFLDKDIEKYGLVLIRSRIQRIHVMYFHDGIFKVPPFVDRDYGSPFYGRDQIVRRDIEEVRKAKGRAAATYYEWLKNQFHDLQKIESSSSIIWEGELDLGDVTYKVAEASQLNLDWIAQNCLIEKRRKAKEAGEPVPSMADIEDDETFQKEVELTHFDLLRSGQAIPESAFSRLEGETCAGFNLRPFSPKMLRTMDQVTPRVELFGKHLEHHDRVVFNGEPLPF